MNITETRNPFAAVVRSLQEEIDRYKWIESEKAGRDIGWQRAAGEWWERHFPGWKRAHWDEAIRRADQAAHALN